MHRVRNTIRRGTALFAALGTAVSMLLPGASLSVSAAEAVPVTQTIEASAVTGTAEGAMGTAGTGAGETTTTVTNRTTTSETANSGISSNSTNSTNTINDTNTVNGTGGTDENDASAISDSGNNSVNGNNSDSGNNSGTGNNSSTGNNYDAGSSDAGNNSVTSNESNASGSGAVTNRSGSTTTNRTTGSSVTNRSGSSASSYDNNSSESASGSSASTRRNGSGTTSHTAGSTSGRTSNSSSGSTSSVLRDWDFVPGAYDVNSNRITITTTELTKEEIVKRLPQYVRNNATDTEIRIQSYVNRAYKEGKEGTYVFTAKLPSGYRVTSGSLKIRVKTVEGTEHPDYPGKLEDSASDGNTAEVTDGDSPDNSEEAVTASDGHGSASGESARDSSASTDNKDSNASKDTSAAEGNIFQRIIRRVTSLFTGEEENTDSGSADSSDASGNANSKESADAERSAESSGPDAGSSAADESKENRESGSRATVSNDSGESSGASSASGNNGFASGTANSSSAENTSPRNDSSKTGFSTSSSGAPRRAPKSNDTVKATDLQDAEKLDSAETDESGEGTSITDETGKNNADGTASDTGSASVSSDQSADGRDASGKETSGTPDNSNTDLTSRTASGETPADAGNAESVSGSDAGSDTDGKSVSSGTGSDGKDAGSEDGKKQDTDSDQAADKDGKDSDHSKNSDATDISKDKSGSDSGQDSDGKSADTGTTKKPVYKWNVGDVIDFFNGKTPMEETSGAEASGEGTTASEEASKDSSNAEESGKYSTEESSDKDSTEASEASTDKDSTEASETSMEAATEASTEETADETDEKPSLLSRIKSAFAKLGGPRKVISNSDSGYAIYIPDNDKAYTNGTSAATYKLSYDNIQFQIPVDGKIHSLEISSDDNGTITGKPAITQNSLQIYTLEDGKDYLILDNSDTGLTDDVLRQLIEGFVFKPDSGKTQSVNIKISANQNTILPRDGSLIREKRNGQHVHYYFYDSTSADWVTAYFKANSYILNGMKGYLMVPDDTTDIDALNKMGNIKGWLGASTAKYNGTVNKKDFPGDGRFVNLATTADQNKYSDYKTNIEQVTPAYWTGGYSGGNAVSNLPNLSKDNTNPVGLELQSKNNYLWRDLKDNNNTSGGFYVEFSGDYDQAYDGDDQSANQTINIIPNDITVRYHLQSMESDSAAGRFTDAAVTSPKKCKLNTDKTILTSIIKDNSSLDSENEFPHWTINTTADSTSGDISASGNVLLYFEGTDSEGETKIYWPSDVLAVQDVNQDDDGPYLDLYAVWMDVNNLQKAFSFDTKNLDGDVGVAYFNEKSGTDIVTDKAKSITTVQVHSLTTDGFATSFDISVDKRKALSGLDGYNESNPMKLLEDVANEMQADKRSRISDYMKVASALGSVAKLNTIGDIIKLGETPSRPQPTDQANGYVFQNWDLNDNGRYGTAADVAAIKLIYAEPTYYAVYKLGGTITHEVIFHIYDADVRANNPRIHNDAEDNGEGYGKLTITYNPNDPDGVRVLEPGTADGFTFLGWYDNQDRTKGTIVKGIPSKPTQDYELFGWFEATTYYLDYDPVKGTLDAQVQNPKKFKSSDSQFDLPVPTKTGYVFDGWYYDSNYLRAMPNNGKGPLDPRTSENKQTLDKYSDDNHHVKVYAKYKAKDYHISYQKLVNNNTKNDYEDGIINKETLTLDNDTWYLRSPQKEGYTFIGWYETSDFNGDPVSYIEPKYLTTKDASNSDTPYTLYAKWQEGTSADITTYHILYVKNGGELDSTDWPNPQQVQSNYLNTSLYTATKNSYPIEGWYLTSKLDDTEDTVDGIKLGEKVPQVLTPDQIAAYIKAVDPTDGTTLTLYAKYPDEAEKAGNFTLTYHPLKGVMPAGYAEPYQYTYKYSDSEIRLPKPAREGFTFRGWHRDPYLEDDVVTTINPEDEKGNKNIDLYADWGSSEYTITYHLDGGENSKFNPEVVDPGSNKVQLSPATKEGYKFDGWYTEPEFETMVTVLDPSKMTGPIELYAKFEGGENSSNAASTGSSTSDANGTRRMAANGGATISAQNGILPAVTGNTITGTGVRTVSTGDEGNIYAWGTSFLLAAGSLVVWLLTHNIPLADAGPVEPRRRKARAQAGTEDSGKSLRDLMER